MLLGASALALAIGVLSAPASFANYEANCTGNGTVVAGASMNIDGVNAQQSVGSPWFYACKDATKSYFTVMIGLLQNDGKLVSDLGVGNATKTFEVTFPVSGDAITIAQGVGQITSFTPSASSVVVAIRPVLASTVWSNQRPAGCDPISDATGNYKAECAGTTASATEYVARFEVRYGASSWTPLTGMYVSTSADLFQVDLGNTRCPTQSYSGGTSSDGGSGRPSQLRADVETSLRVQMLGPHFAANGTTLNTGTLNAVLPFATVETCFGKPPTDLASGVSMTRTEDGTTLAGSPTGTGGLQFTVTPSAAGLVVNVPEVTFSQPTYNLKFATPATSGTTTDTSNAESSSVSTIAGVKAKGAKGKITATFTKDSSVKSYAAKSKLSSGKGAWKKGKCAIKGSNVSCTVKKLKKGTWNLYLTSTLTSGGAGPSATKTKIKVK